jgi:hypothetical protein
VLVEYLSIESNSINRANFSMHLEQKIIVTGSANGFSKLHIRRLCGSNRVYIKNDLDRYHEYLGDRNSSYGPPKKYKINRGDYGFGIQLPDVGNK